MASERETEEQWRERVETHRLRTNTLARFLRRVGDRDEFRSNAAERILMWFDRDFVGDP